MRKVILLALGFIASGCAAQTFQNPRLLPTPHNVSTMLHGDLNGDGFDDIVYGDFATNPATLHVLLGDGRGGLAPGVTLTLPAYTPDNCKLARFTGSGSLDIACLVEPAGYGNSTLPLSIAVFPGRGDGTFSSPRTIDLSGQQYSQGILVVAGDLNGDGVPDMVVEQGGQGFPVLSDGHGRWVIGKTRNYYGVPIYTGDLNGDGQVDWIFSGPVVVLGNGDATFGAPQDYNPPNLAVQACAFGDLDGDGHVDAACGSATTISGNISGHWSIDFFHGNADGSFTPLPSHRMSFGDGSVSWEGYGSRAVPNYIVDLNGDGIPDLLGVSADGLTAYFGKGTYEFGSPVHFAAGNLTTLSGTASTNWILTDLNGDHLPDVVSGSFDGVLITLGKAGKGFDTASAYEVNGVAGYVAVADFNGDGVPDIVSTGDLHMAISLGRGDGSFLPYKNLDTGTVHWEGLYQHPDDNLLVHGDFNGDGKEDLFAVGSEVSGSFNENEYYLQGNGDGTFQSPVTVSQAPGLSYLYGLTVVADLNGDHRDDLIGKPDSSTGKIYASISQGGGRFNALGSSVPQEFTGFNNGFYYQEPFPGVADFDGDGKPDIVVGARSNAYVLHGNGDGTFRDPVSIPIPPRPNAATGDGSVSVATGDFDGDGHKDFAILWGTVTYGVYINGPGSFGEILVYYGKGDGTFAAPVVAAYTNADYVKIMAADLRHDGRDEIVAHASGTLNGGTNVGILLGAANRTFSPITPLVAGYGLSNLQIADLNGDGLPDLVFCNQDYNIEANSATVLLNLGSKPFVTGSLSAQPEPSLVGNPFTLTATFLTPDASTVTGPIAFSVDGNTVGSANLNNNAASVSVPGNYTVGAHTLSAAWAGNTTFDPVTLAGTHTVIAVSTTLSLTSSTNPSVINQPVTFTAQVTAANGQIPTGSVTFTAGGTLISAPVVVNVSPTGTLSVSVTTSALPVGNTAITANYVPLQSGGTFSASAATLTQRVLDGFPSTTTLTSSLNPSTATQSVTFTAQVTAQTAANGTLLGSITFTDGTVTLGTQPLDASGSAIFTTSALSVGAHPILATYFSSNSFASSFSSLTQTVDALPTTALLVASPTTSTYGTAVTLKASVGSSPPGGPALTGTVTFCNTVSLLGKNVCSGTVLGTLPLSAGGTANLPLPSPPAGTSTFGCIYSGDAVYASAVCNAVSVTVNPALTALTLTSSANPSTALTPITFTANLTSSGVPVAQQSLTFSVDGKNLTPVATSAGGSTGISASLTAGAHTIAVTYVATANYAASVAQLTEITTPNGTVTTLSASPTPTYQNQPVTITATVQAQTGAATPDGFVTFYDGSVLLSTFALPPFAYTGTVSTAALTTSTLAPGRHTLTAVYSPAAQPSPNFIASASSPVDITVLPQTFSITLADPTLTIQTEHHRATTVTLTSIGGFNGRVTLACDLLPDYASCTWQNSTLVLLPNGTATTQLVVDTDALLNYKSSVHRTPMPWRESGGLMLAVMAPLIFFRRRRRLSTLLPLALLAALGFFAVGCSSKYPGHTLPGTYGINIKGAGTSAGAVSPTLQSTTMTLVVTP